MKDKKYSNTDLSNLKSPISGGDALSVEKETEINKYLKDRGCKYKLQQGYGMTEVSAAACYSMEKSYSLGSVGIPYVKNNVAIVDSDNELETNQIGEIKISTPTMMKGYYNNERATNEIIKVGLDEKRWIETGDLGYIGKEILGEMAQSKGYNINANYNDCGVLMFDKEKQDTHSGGSGCACIATVFSGYFFKQLQEKKIKRLLLMATGALMNSTSMQQGESIPGIAHAISIEVKEN